MKYAVNFYDYNTGATSTIDNIEAKAGYTAEQYVEDCAENADPEWNDMISDGKITLEALEELTEKSAIELLNTFIASNTEYNCDTDSICESDNGFQFLLDTDHGTYRTLYVNHDAEDENTGIAHVRLGVETA